RTAEKYRDLFGADRYFIELMDHGIPEQRKILPDLLRLSEETGIPVVATNDAHYLVREDSKAQEVLLCIGTGRKLDDPKRLRFYNDEFYVKSPDEMKEAFRTTSLEAVSNSAAIASRVAPKVIMDSELQLPSFPFPEGYATADAYLEALATEGLAARLEPLTELFAQGRIRHSREEYDERLRWELGVIQSMGLSSYFLIVWDFIRYARVKGIPVGPGRGSAAGSLVAWTLEITDVDPLRYDLLFERFLNLDRVSMPDIDVDLCERRRGEVIEYVRQKYGRENVGQIITFNSMKARAVIRDVGRVLGVDLGEVNRLCSMIPANPGKPTTLAEARREVRELAEALSGNETYRRLFDLGERLEGVSRHAGVHAAGILIAPRPLVEFLPLYRNNNEEITTQFEMKAVDKMGLLKMDFLGLITLTILDDAALLVERRTGTKPSFPSIPLNDPEVFRLFSEGRTDGVFQFESSGMRDLLRRVQPTVFDDLSAVNALYRPGALDAGTVEVYIERRRGKKFDYPLPQLEPILKDTYGVLVYQEQVMLAARLVAGYTPREADKLRKAIGKKDDATLMAEGERFIKKAVAAGTPK
ncbi:MAG TPA: DNA polymerase III subunit alpha, partial [Thermoanaerobaculia bacterium]